MAFWCHRCGGELAAAGGEVAFCQHCGAPQLRVLEENVDADGASGREEASKQAEPGALVWSSAAMYAAIVAGISAVSMVAVVWLPVGFPLAWLWTVCGGVVVLGLYQRRHPASVVNARVGARVGLIYGLFAVTTLAVAAAAVGVLARFGLHTMGTLDGLLNNAMRQAAEQQASQPGALALSAEQIRTFYSPEVRAGLAIFLMTVSAGFLLLFSVAGGAVGGMMRTRRMSGTGTAGN